MTAVPTLFDATAADVLADTPGRVHRDARPTELAAARGVKSGTQKARVLVVLAAAGDDGLTDFECHQRAGLCRPHVAGTRRADLMRLGMVVEVDGVTRPTDTGAQALVWRCTELGLRTARELGQ